MMQLLDFACEIELEIRLRQRRYVRTRMGGRVFPAGWHGQAPVLGNLRDFRAIRARMMSLTRMAGGTRGYNSLQSNVPRIATTIITKVQVTRAPATHRMTSSACSTPHASSQTPG